MLKPGIFPPSQPRKTESHAELRVYQALARQLPKGWIAWHSLRIRIPGHPDAEADFVIADPGRGILILEVKGGRVEVRDGVWYSNSKPLKQAPREQANRFVRELIRLLQSQGVDPPPCGIATCFPDTDYTCEPGQGDLRGCVLGAQDLNWLDRALPEILDCALMKGFRPRGKWIQAVHDLWGETWVPKMDFGLKARIDEEERIRLDAEQLVIMDGLMENRSVLVTGPAGTGKTVIALAVARKLASSGKKVLMLCFTEPLAQWLNTRVDTPGLTVRAIKRYALELLEQAGMSETVQDTSEFWSGVTLDATADALPVVKPSWDAVVVDEGQDLNDDDWMLVAELSRAALRWAFWDPEQAFWPDRGIRGELFEARYKLQKKYRCPAAVLALAGSYLSGVPENIPPGESSGVEPVGVHSCPGPGTVPDAIAHELDRLKVSGLSDSDIAVLSLRGAAEPGAVVHREHIGTHKVVRAHSAEAGSHIVAETFLRFKGLERAAIIITDIGLALDKPDYRKRMYLALTRALVAVRIIDTRDALSHDPLLSQFACH